MVSTLIEILLIAIALSMDAFSVSISCGIKLPHNTYKKFLKIALAFGLFQAIMPLLGYYFSSIFLKNFLQNYADLLSFVVFFVLALKTSKDYFSRANTDEVKHCHCEGLKCLTTLAIATSIDAFLIGSVLGLKQANLALSVLFIGLITLMISYLGCVLGNKAISKLKRHSTLVAALILYILAIKSILS